MTDTGTVELVVQGDDFGMCHAVNQGVQAAYTNGILTQSSLMAACPWADEAMAMAAEDDIPLGLHQTLTCDWDRLRWGPLTSGLSLMGEDGMFHSTVAEAAGRVDPAEAEVELIAQARRAQRAGIELAYLDVHMGQVCLPAYQAVSDALRVPFLYPGLTTSLSFTSIKMLSARERGEKKDWLLGWLRRLTPGRHLLVTHPGTPGPELGALATSDSPVFRWAEEYRATDLEVLTDPDVARAVADLGIRLATVGPGPD